MTVETIPPEQGALDLQALVDNLDQRGLLVLQVLLGQRAITLLEAKPKPKSSIIQNTPKLIAP